MDSHRELIAWQKAMVLVTSIYEATAEFPKAELYGLTAQIRRSAVSVPSNIAEGKGRRSKKEFEHFLYCARGSLLEAETQLQIAVNLGYMKEDGFARIAEQAQEVGRVLNGLISAISSAAKAEIREPGGSAAS